MRPSLLLAAASLFSCLAPNLARADGPADPFQAAPAGPGSDVGASLLLDPFAAPASAETARGSLDDPFTATAAPSCPPRATASGIVIQRPAAAACPTPAATKGLIDPFAT